MFSINWNRHESEIIDGVWYPSDDAGLNLPLVREIRALVRRMLELEQAEPLIAELDNLFERSYFPLP